MPKRILQRKIPSPVKNPDLVEARRSQIFEGAWRLFMKKGYHVTGLRELSRETGISLGNLYNYINTKEDILYIIHQKAAEIVVQAINEQTSDVIDPLEKLKEMIDIELRTMDKYQDLILLIYQESHALSRKSLHSMLQREESHIQRFQRVLEEGMVAGVFKRSNPKMLANLIKMMIDGWVLKRWALRGRVSLKQMKKGIIDLVEHGIRSGKEVPVSKSVKPKRIRLQKERGLKS
jgi:AcrR family transcriptional regulator